MCSDSRSVNSSRRRRGAGFTGRSSRSIALSCGTAAVAWRRRRSGRRLNSVLTPTWGPLRSLICCSARSARFVSRLRVAPCAQASRRRRDKRWSRPAVSRRNAPYHGAGRIALNSRSVHGNGVVASHVQAERRGFKLTPFLSSSGKSARATPELHPVAGAISVRSAAHAPGLSRRFAYCTRANTAGAQSPQGTTLRLRTGTRESCGMAADRPSSRTRCSSPSP